MPMFQIFASIDSFVIMLALGIGSALVEWWQRKKQGGRPESPDSPAAPSETAPRPSAQPGDWEEELRRLLQGEPSKPDTAPPPAPAPQVNRPDPAPVPPLVIPQPEPARPSRLPRESVNEAAPAPSTDLANLSESAVAYHRASSLEQLAQAQIRTATARTEHPTSFSPPPHRIQVTPEVAQVLHSLQQPHTARQAMVGSIILGPPRAFDPLH